MVEVLQLTMPVVTLLALGWWLRPRQFECHTHVDTNGNGRCDNCNGTRPRK